MIRQLIIDILKSISVIATIIVAIIVIKNEIPVMKKKKYEKEHAKNEQQKAFERSRRSNRMHLFCKIITFGNHLYKSIKPDKFGRIAQCRICKDFKERENRK